MALLTTAELAERLGITERTLVDWRKSGCPHTRKDSGKRSPCYYELESVQAWLAEQSITGRPGRPALGSERDKPLKEVATGGPRGLSSESDERLRRLAREADVALKQAKAERERLAVQRARGELVPIDEVLREHGEMVSRVRSRILATPGAMSSSLARELDPRKVEAALDDHLRTILEGLAI